MAGVAGRWRWLGSPWFLGSVVVLAVNDHLLKARFSGWWTGKLSDFAGLVVVCVIAAVVVGEVPGAMVAGVGFVALKTVPGVAEIFAPILGGPTIRDGTDLVAVVVLVPTTVALLRDSRAGPSARPIEAIDEGTSLRSRRRALGASVLPIVGAVVAMFATTATSCGPRPAVERLLVVDDVVYAEVITGWDSEWAHSTDGGKIWARADRPPRRAIPREGDSSEATPTGPVSACGDDGTCFRLRNQRVIEVTAPTGETIAEFTLTEVQLNAISTGCAGAQRGVLTSVAAPTAAGQPAMASLGAHGVVVRQDDGRWARAGVLDARPPSPEPPAAIRVGSLVFGPFLALVIWMYGRDRWPSWRVGIGVAVAGWMGSICLAGAVDFVTGPDNYLGTAVLLPSGCVITLLAAVLVGKSSRFAPRPRPEHWPPPPPPGVS